MKNNKLLCAVLLIGCLFLTSCRKRIEVITNAFADHESIGFDFDPGATFKIESQDENEMLGKEMNRIVTRILRTQGYVVTSKQDADYVVRFKTSTRKGVQKISVPKYIPGEEKITRGHVTNGEDLVEYQQQTLVPGQTIYVEKEVPIYTREVKIHVFDGALLRGGKRNQVWQATAVSHGACDDIREVVTYMLDEMFKYFGHDTPKKIVTEIPLEWDWVGQYY